MTPQVYQLVVSACGVQEVAGETRPTYVLASLRYQFNEYIQRHNIPRQNARYVSSTWPLLGLRSCRVVILPGWENLFDSEVVMAVAQSLRWRDCEIIIDDGRSPAAPEAFLEPHVLAG